MRYISTTIKRKYMDMKLNDLKKDKFFYEYKEVKHFWKIRFDKICRLDKDLKDIQIVFMMGKTTYRFKVTELITVLTNTIPIKYQSAINSEEVYRIKCIQDPENIEETPIN